MKLLIVLTLICLQATIPFKAADEFQVNVELKLKARPTEYVKYDYSLDGVNLDKPKGEVRPFLEADVVNLVIHDDEKYMKITDSEGKLLLKKKIQVKPDIHLMLGFLEDMKSKLAPNQFTILFLSSKKTELRKIVMTVTTEGEFLVNGKWHGKF